jgi:hypothetical protein
MKKFIFISALLLSAVFYVGCDDNGTEPAGNGTILITSTPSGAAIYLDGTNTNQVTPATIEAPEGVREVTLKFAGFLDYTTSISVQADQQSVLGPVILTVQGSIEITTTPAGASIHLDGTNLNQQTPYTISGLQADAYQVLLTLSDYKDTTITVTVTDGNKTTVNVILQPEVMKYGPVRLYETTGTTAAQPNGLDLSSGSAYGISSDEKVNVDIFYSSSGFLVKSASEHTSMTRETKFKVGSAGSLNDGVDSPTADASWAVEMSDRETNYVFLYDEDGHYSKIKIVNFGGGAPGEPAWLEVEWIYNKADQNKSF